MLNPWFVTGLFDGEGCFSLIVHKDKQQRKNSVATYYRWRAIFIIAFRGDDSEILYSLKDFFNCGRVQMTHPKAYAKIHNLGRVEYVVTSIDDLVNIIIPHFENYPLQTKKKKDFLFWKEAVFILKSARETNNGLFKKVIIGEGQKIRLNKIHGLLRERVTGGHLNTEVKNLLKDGIKEVEYTKNIS